MTWLHRYGTQNICVLVPKINLISLQESFTFFFIFNKLFSTAQNNTVVVKSLPSKQTTVRLILLPSLNNSAARRERYTRKTSNNKSILNYVDSTFFVPCEKI